MDSKEARVAALLRDISDHNYLETACLLERIGASPRRTDAEARYRPYLTEL